METKRSVLHDITCTNNWCMARTTNDGQFFGICVVDQEKNLIISREHYQTRESIHRPDCTLFYCQLQDGSDGLKYGLCVCCKKEKNRKKEDAANCPVTKNYKEFVQLAIDDVKNAKTRTEAEKQAIIWCNRFWEKWHDIEEEEFIRFPAKLYAAGLKKFGKQFHLFTGMHCDPATGLSETDDPVIGVGGLEIGASQFVSALYEELSR